MDNETNLETVFKDFSTDLLLTFPEYKTIIDDCMEGEDYVNTLSEYCKTIYPERFFDILYKNKDIFTNDETNCHFLPGLDFKLLWKCDISDNTRDTIWKYLQLILFSVIQGNNDETMFGDTAKLFEAINSDDLHSKLEETLHSMKDIFDNNVDMNTDTDTDVDKETDQDPSPKVDVNSDTSEEKKKTPPSNPFNIDPETFQNHLSGMLDGKIGKLAAEIAEEAAKDIQMPDDETADPENLLKNLFKNPGKIMGLVKNIGSKLDQKMKSGDINESELLEEASNIMSTMQDIPGLKEMMAQMGMSGTGGKFDFNAMRNHMQNNLKTSKNKDRMRDVLKKRQEEKEKATAEAAKSLTKTGQNEFTFNADDGSTQTKSSKKTGKKKRRKKKTKK